jgi:hypothetical protein
LEEGVHGGINQKEQEITGGEKAQNQPTDCIAAQAAQLVEAEDWKNLEGAPLGEQRQENDLHDYTGQPQRGIQCVQCH